MPTNPALGLLEGSAVRPRSAKHVTTWVELPARALKLICQNLDHPSVLAARCTAKELRDACCEAPVPLRFTLPMQMNAWLPVQLKAWERRMVGVARMLGAGRMTASCLQLRAEGAAAWKEEEAISPGPAQMAATVRNMMLLLAQLAHFGALSAAGRPITQLDLDLPITVEILSMIAGLLLDVQTLRLDSLLPPSHNHVAALAEVVAGHQFSRLRKLDLAVTAWDHLQGVSVLTDLTDLTVRYKMWNIPELSCLTPLTELTSLNFQVLDDRARFQLDFLGSAVTGLPKLEHLTASVILARTAVDSSGTASCEWLDEVYLLQTLNLDLRVPVDSMATPHVHLRGLHYVTSDCEVNITIRADSLARDGGYESAATPGGTITVPRLGCGMPDAKDAKDRWGSLDMLTQSEGVHGPDALTLLHLRGYTRRLTCLPDMSGARLTRLQITHARLGLQDFAVLSSCFTLQHLHVCFAYLPPAHPQPAVGHAALPPSPGLLRVLGVDEGSGEGASGRAGAAGGGSRGGAAGAGGAGGRAAAAAGGAGGRAAGSARGEGAAGPSGSGAGRALLAVLPDAAAARRNSSGSAVGSGAGGGAVAVGRPPLAPGAKAAAAAVHATNRARVACLGVPPSPAFLRAQERAVQGASYGVSAAALEPHGPMTRLRRKSSQQSAGSAATTTTVTTTTASAAQSTFGGGGGATSAAGGGGAGGGAGAGAVGARPSCAVAPPAIALSPLVLLRRLRTLEIVEERDLALGGKSAAAAAAGTGAQRAADAATAAAGPGPSGVNGGGSSAGATVAQRGPGPQGPAARTRSRSAPGPGCMGGEGSAPGDGDAAAAALEPEPPADPRAQLDLANAMPLSRAGLLRFLSQLAAMPRLQALRLRLLRGEGPGEERALPDCPCPHSCFAGGAGAAVGGSGGGGGGGGSSGEKRRRSVAAPQPEWRPLAPIGREEVLARLGGSGSLVTYSVVLGAWSGQGRAEGAAGAGAEQQPQVQQGDGSEPGPSSRPGQQPQGGPSREQHPQQQGAQAGDGAAGAEAPAGAAVPQQLLPRSDGVLVVDTAQPATWLRPSSWPPCDG